MRQVSVLLFFLCAGCAGPVPHTPSTAGLPANKPMLSASDLRELSPSEKTQLGRLLAKGLKDPESAQFRWAPFPKGTVDGPVSYCAQVNARNSYGGYNGFQPFIGVIGMKGGKIAEAAIGAIADTRPSYSDIVPEMCRKEGLNPFAVER